MNVRIEGMIKERFETAIRINYSRLEVKSIMLGYLYALGDADIITEKEVLKGIRYLNNWYFEKVIK